MRDPVKGQTVIDRKLGTFFPNVAYSKKFGVSVFFVAYAKRISRPSYNDLASFVVYTSPNSIESGNPFLLPTVTHNLKLGYSYKGYAFSVLLSRDEHPIAGYQLAISPDGDLIDVRPENLVYQNNLMLEAILPFKVTDWWSMNYNFSAGWRHFKEDFTLLPAEKSYFGCSVNASQQFRLPAAFMMELSGWYNGPSYNGTKKVDGFGAVNGGIKKELPNNGGTLQLSVQDIFRTMHVASRYGTLTTEAFDVKSHVVFTAESGKAQIFKLTYSRSFGGGGAGDRRGGGAGGRRGGGAADERERVRK
jgi:hypothetical protein